MKSLSIFLSLLFVAAHASPSPIPVTFGNGLAGVPVCTDRPTMMLEYTLTPAAAYGLMTHLWSTGDDSLDDVIVEYFIDGETSPSIALQPAIAAGQGFDSTAGDYVGEGGLFTAGGKMGKAANVGAYYTYARIPFYTSIYIRARALPGVPCRAAYLNVRGFEVARDSSMADGFALPSGFVVPFGARMQLQQIEGQLFPPLWFVSLANITFGQSSILLQHTMVTETRPVGNNYIEGCWHLMTNGSAGVTESIVLGTGFEDFYDSSFWFSAASGYPASLPFQHPNSGLTFFSRRNNTERISAYRFFDNEVVGFSDGGRLVWRVGDQTSKCHTTGTASPIGSPSAVRITSYAWLYTWPNGRPVVPLTPLPQAHMSYTCRGSQCVALPDASGAHWNADCSGACSSPAPPPVPGPPAIVGCSSGQCDAFCNSSNTVHGCLAMWDGVVSLRAPPTGRPCGGRLGPCTSPADACAPGWALCLSHANASGSESRADVASFLKGMGPQLCREGDPRMFLAAMQHADPAWSALPPSPCPPAPQEGDNGCRPAGWGSEPICCGGACTVPSCGNDLWMDQTRIHIGESEGCGAVSANYASGILCCKLD